jgi:hypothetical protein
MVLDVALGVGLGVVIGIALGVGVIVPGPMGELFQPKSSMRTHNLLV